MWAVVRFLFGVNEGVHIQTALLTKRLVALLANVFLDPTVDPLVKEKAASTCKCLWTQATRHLIGHFVTSTLFCRPPLTVFS